VSSAPQFVHVVAMCQRPLVVLGKWRQAQASQSIHGTGIVRVLFVSPSGALNDPIAVGRTPGVTGRSLRVDAVDSGRRRTEVPEGAAAGGGVLGYPSSPLARRHLPRGHPPEASPSAATAHATPPQPPPSLAVAGSAGTDFPADYPVFAFVLVFVGRLIIASSAGK